MEVVRQRPVLLGVCETRLRGFGFKVPQHYHVTDEVDRTGLIGGSWHKKLTSASVAVSIAAEVVGCDQPLQFVFPVQKFPAKSNAPTTLTVTTGNQPQKRLA